jgi:hypothetical protein
MEKSTFSVSYFLRKNKKYRNGSAPLLVRITYNGVRSEFTSNHNVKPEYWDQKSNRAIGQTNYSSKINKLLDHIYMSLCVSIKELEERGIEVTAENIKNNYLGLIEFKQATLLSLYTEHNTKMEALVGKTYAFSTLQKHLTTLEHLKDFLKREYKSGDIAMEKVNTQFLLDFEFFLKTEKCISNNTTIKYLKNLGKVVRVGINAGYISRDPFATIKFHHEEVETVFLDRSELQSILDKEFDIKRLDQVRDAFLFCCFTGLAFADVKALTTDCLYEPNKGEIWINKKGKTHLGYYWAYYAPLAGAVVFDYQKGRGAEAPRAFLDHYNGYLQTDGYQVYKQYYANDRVIHLACWAHVRRKFEHALDNNKEIAEHVLLEIQKLYSIERKTKELSARETKELRLNEALPIINALGKYLGYKRNLVPPTSETGKAITYATNLWSSLQNYLYEGNLQIDNNLIENKIRPIALGRKNYLFAGSHNGAERSAMFYSFFSCCKLNNINPKKWMVYVLANIADYPANKIHELLPNIIDPEKLENHRDFWERKV